MTTPNNDYEVVIAGQGAAAFSAALYAARYQLRSVVIGETFGGETAIGGIIENYPGYPDIDGFDLMMKFREQVDKYKVPILDDKVVTLERDGHSFRTTTTGGETFHSSTVILAVGRERRKIGLEHEEEWIGRGVSFCSTCDAPLHQGNTVAVVGGGNAAVEGAVLISRYAEKVYLIYRRKEFTRPEPVLVKRLNETGNIEQVLNTNVKELKGESGLSSIVLDRPVGDSNELAVDGLFIEIGADPRVDLPNQLDAELNEENELIVNKLMQTSVHGLLAAGDLTDASGTLKQTVTAAAQGAIAATSAYNDLSEHTEPCRWHAQSLSVGTG